MLTERNVQSAICPAGGSKRQPRSATQRKGLWLDKTKRITFDMCYKMRCKHAVTTCLATVACLMFTQKLDYCVYSNRLFKCIFVWQHPTVIQRGTRWNHLTQQFKISYCCFVSIKFADNENHVTDICFVLRIMCMTTCLCMCSNWTSINLCPSCFNKVALLKWLLILHLEHSYLMGSWLPFRAQDAWASSDMCNNMGVVGRL